MGKIRSIQLKSTSDYYGLDDDITELSNKHRDRDCKSCDPVKMRLTMGDSQKPITQKITIIKGLKKPRVGLFVSFLHKY